MLPSTNGFVNLRKQPLVLVVEDHLEMQQALVEIFRWEAIDTLTVTTGDGALALLHAQLPNLVILDLELHGTMSGIEVLAAIRNTPSLAGTPVVLHTSYPATDSLLEAHAADLVLVKPVIPDHLLTLVQRLLSLTIGENPGNFPM